MKKAHVISIFSALLFLFVSGSALADEEFGPGVYDDECDDPTLMVDMEKCCDREADEASRVETARSILRVHARTVGDPPVAEDDDHFHIAINGWAVDGSGRDGVGYDGAVYQETTLSNFGRQEMWDYLVKIFNWSSDMELIIYDELWETHPDDSMTYMLVNKWFGSTSAGYYEQPGISIVKFRPGEGCAAFQRDYFSEGDTWFGMSMPGFDAQGMVIERRNRIITELGLTDKCVDDDGDGFTKYAAAGGCPEGDVVDCDDYHDDIYPVDDDEDGYFASDGPCPGDDCDDTDPDINPGATEVRGDGIDSNCNGKEGCATFPVTPEGPLDLLPFFALFLVPAVYGYVLKRRLARNRIK